MSKYLFKCDRCSAMDVRLHAIDNKDDDDHIILCDDCYTNESGHVAVCEDFCTLHLDHTGLCREI